VYLASGQTLLKGPTRRTLVVMANDDDKDKPLPPPALPPQQQAWEPEPWLRRPQPPLIHPNPLLYVNSQATDSTTQFPPRQDASVEPQVVAAVGQAAGKGQADAVGASTAMATGIATGEGLAHAVSNAVLSEGAFVISGGRAEMTLTEEIEARFQEALRHAADLTSCIDQLRKASTRRKIGPGHNQGPPLQDLVQVDDLIALLKDEGPRVKTVVDAKALIVQTEKVKRLPERIWSWLKAAGLLVIGIGAHEVTKDLTAPLWDEVAHRIVDLCHAIEVWVSLLPPM